MPPVGRLWPSGHDGHDAYLLPPLLQGLHPEGELAHRPHRRRLPTTLRLSLKIVLTMANTEHGAMVEDAIGDVVYDIYESYQLLSHSHPPLH